MPKRTIEDEQRDFDRQLPELLKKHVGLFSLFHEGKAVSFFSTRDEAYRAGLEQFGLDEVFLVAQVKAKETETVSLSWELGVMFGQ